MKLDFSSETEVTCPVMAARTSWTTEGSEAGPVN